MLYKIPYFITKTGYRFVEAPSPEEAVAIAETTQGQVFPATEPHYEIDYDLPVRPYEILPI